MSLVSRLLVAIFLAAAAACGGREADGAAVAAAPPLNDTPVGPLPGPEGTAGEEPVNPFEQDKDALAEGRRFFVQYNCAGCHGDHGGGGMGPSLRDASWIYGDGHAKVADSIVEGRAYGIPAWGRMLTAAQVWQITAYIKSMRTSDEPERPQ